MYDARARARPAAGAHRASLIHHNRVNVEGATAQQRIAAVRTRGLAVGVAASAAIAVAAWPVRGVTPGIGGDWGWVAGLSYAAEHGLRFGDEIAWSYGPLGFFETTYGPVLYYGGVLLASWLFAAVVQLLLAGTLLLALRRAFPLALAALAAAVVLALASNRTLALGFAWCALAATRAQGAPRGRLAAAFPFAIGALTGIVLLGKLNQGAELLVLAGLTLAASGRRRDAGAFAGALLASAAIGWLATGQALGDVWPYVRNGVQVVAGYAPAMGAADPALRWTYAAALAAIALLLACAWDAGRGQPGLRRWAPLALGAVYAFFGFKESFVRQDPGHVAELFGDLLVAFAVLLARPARRLLLPASVAASAVAIAAVLGLADVGRMLNPAANARAAADQVRTLASPARQDAIAAAVRQGVDAEYHVAPRLLAAVGRRSAMLWPNLWAEVAYADGLNLRPLPSLEPYATYTPALDRLGARMLAGARAPQRILRALAQGMDGRLATFEAPLATLAILCRYRPLAAQQPWQVLARGADRCGAPRALATVSAPWGAAVRVPPPRRPGALVLVRVEGAGPHGIEQLRSLLLRPARRFVALDANRFPLVAATAADGLLLRAPAAADFPRPFAMAPNPSRIAVSRDGGNPGGALRYAFVEVPIAPLG